MEKIVKLVLLKIDKLDRPPNYWLNFSIFGRSEDFLLIKKRELSL